MHTRSSSTWHDRQCVPSKERCHVASVSASRRAPQAQTARKKFLIELEAHCIQRMNCVAATAWYYSRHFVQRHLQRDHYAQVFRGVPSDAREGAVCVKFSRILRISATEALHSIMISPTRIWIFGLGFKRIRNARYHCAADFMFTICRRCLQRLHSCIQQLLQISSQSTHTSEPSMSSSPKPHQASCIRLAPTPPSYRSTRRQKVICRSRARAKECSDAGN